MNTIRKQVTIKISGELHPVMRTLRKIETLFPFNVEGQVNKNDRDDGVHIFLTIPAEETETVGVESLGAE